MRRIVIRRVADVKNFDEVEAERLESELAHLRRSAADKAAIARAYENVGSRIAVRQEDGTVETADRDALLEQIELCWMRDEECVHELTRWEQDFLDSIQARIETGKGLTEKQLLILDRISEAEDTKRGRF